MKMNYKRLTQRLYGQIYSVNQRIYYDDVADIVERLAELEDKIESGELVEKTELDKALALKQEQGQDLTVKTIFKYTEEIKALKAENEDLKYHLKKLWEITDRYISNMDKCFKGDQGE